jgi:hypothetical protein
MEFAALLLASLLALVTCMEETSQPRDEIVLFAMLLLTALARPEGAVFAACAAAALVGHRRTARGPVGLTLWRLALMVALPGAAYFAWRVSYYGQWLPNTYYAKARGVLQPRSLDTMAEFFVLFLMTPALGAVAALVCRLLSLEFACRVRRLVDLEKRTAVVTATAVALFLGVCGTQYAFSALRMNFAYRFFAPLLPLALLLITLVASLAFRGTHARQRHTMEMIAGAILAIALASQTRANVERLPDEVHQAAAYEQLLRLVHVPAGNYIRARVPPNEWMVVVLDAGAIPYYSKLKTIDFGGLNDEFLSQRRHRRIPKSEQADYFFSVNPGVVVFTSKRPDRVDRKRARRFANILEDPRFESYELVAQFSPSSNKYFELVYFRRDLVPRSTFPE